MRHRDDDLAKFRDDPVVQALGAPGSPHELAGEAEAVAAYLQTMTAPVPPPRRRSAARVATGTTVAVLVLAVSGGAAAAYTNHLPDKWQEKLHDKIASVPAPKKHTPAPPVAQHTTPTVPTQSAAPTPAQTGGKAHPTASPSATHATASPDISASAPVGVPSATASTSTVPTATPSPTSSVPAVPAAGGQLQIRVSPGTRVTVGTALSVSGKLTDAHGDVIANRRVVLIERVAGEGRHRVGSSRTSANGEVTIAGPTAQRNLRLVLRSGHARSPITRVVVVPILHVQVPATAAGATSVTVTVSVSGGQAGDVVIVRGPGANDSRQARLDSSLRATFTLPVSQTRAMHYRAEVGATRAHAAHSLAFYVPPSGG